jgi:hypothetical protein
MAFHLASLASISLKSPIKRSLAPMTYAGDMTPIFIYASASALPGTNLSWVDSPACCHVRPVSGLRAKMNGSRALHRGQVIRCHSAYLLLVTAMWLGLGWSYKTF